MLSDDKQYVEWFTADLFNGDYLSIPEGTGSPGYLFHEIPVIFFTHFLKIIVLLIPFLVIIHSFISLSINIDEDIIDLIAS